MNNMNSNRRRYLDNIRWATVVTVVIYHVIYMYNGVQPFGVIGAFNSIQYQDAYQYLTYPWFMALLFIVSGMSARYYLDGHSVKEFIKSKNTKLLIPSTLAIFVFWWIMGYYNMAIGGAFETLALPAEVKQPVRGIIMWIIMSLSGTGVLWYIQMLWVFSMILSVIRRFEKGRLFEKTAGCSAVILILCVIPCFLSAQILNTPVITVYRFGLYGFCYFMGYFVFAHDEVIEALCKIKYVLFVAAAVLGIAYTVVYFGQNYAIKPAINSPLAMAYCWIMILAVMAGFKHYFDIKTPFTEWMSAKSFGLYVFHYLPLAMTAYYLRKYTPGCPAVLCYVLTGVSAFAGGYILYEAVSRIPVLRRVVLGLKGKKNVQ